MTGYTAGRLKVEFGLPMDIEKTYDKLQCYGNYQINTDDNKIPTISHFIWLNYLNYPVEIKNSDIQNMQNEILKLNSKCDKELWQHILWTNTQNIPKTFDAVSNMSVEIRDIHNPFYNLKHVASIDYLLKVNQMGAAIDLLKYDVVNEYGGMVRDLNFAIYDDLTMLYFKHYDFVGMGGIYGTGIENFMFASKHNHPVLNAVLNYIEIKVPLIASHHSQISVTEEYTFLPLLYAFFAVANQDQNCDIVIPLPNYFENKMEHYIINDILKNDCDFNDIYSCFSLALSVSDTCIIGRSYIGEELIEQQTSWDYIPAG